MNSKVLPLPAADAIQFLPPGQGLVNVSACAHPFRMARIDFTVEAGATIAEIFARAQPDAVLRRHAHIFVGDHKIPRENWHRVRPKPGTSIAIRVVPTGGGGGEGGGKSPLRTVLMIAVLAAAVAVSAGALGPAGAGLLGPAFASGGIGATLAGAAIPCAGEVGINLDSAP